MRFLVFLLGCTVMATTAADPLLGLPKLTVPTDNPQTAEKIALGRQLFNDKRLSADGTISCANCHQEDKSFGDSLPAAIGIKGQTGNRNTPSILNAAFYQSLFWDGRAVSLEEQALGPLLNPIEHGLKDRQAIFDVINQDKGYSIGLAQVFGIKVDAVSTTHVAKAIASYERTLIAGDSAFDRYYFGMNPVALSESAARGLRIFRRKGNCANCHEISMNNALFTDNRFYNIGVGFQRLASVIDAWQTAIRRGELPDLSVWSDAQRPELGRYTVTKRPADIGKFKTPSLRNIALTAPYMHDGSLETLEEVVDYYDKGGNGTAFVDPKIFPLHLSVQEKADLVEFLKSLNSLN